MADEQPAHVQQVQTSGELYGNKHHAVRAEDRDPTERRNNEHAVRQRNAQARPGRHPPSSSHRSASNEKEIRTRRQKCQKMRRGDYQKLLDHGQTSEVGEPPESACRQSVCIEENCAGLRPVESGRYTRIVLEHPLKMALIGKAQAVGDIGNRFARTQPGAGLIDAQVQLVAMGRHSC